jgi:hypothetical protein
MRRFYKVLATCLVALASILPFPASAETTGLELQLVSTGALPGYSGWVAIHANKRGTHNFAVRVDGPLEEGELLDVDIVHRNGDGLDLVLMACELGRTSFRCGPGDVEPSPVFPLDRITAFFVYYKGTRVLEARMPA